MSWTIEFGRETPKDGRWSIMTVHSEAEAVRQAKEYLDIGFVVNAIKRPDGSIAHDQDQLNALYHGFDDLALKLAEKRNRRRGATEATPPPDTAAMEFGRSEGFRGVGWRRCIECGKEAVEPKGWLTGIIRSPIQSSPLPVS